MKRKGAVKHQIKNSYDIDDLDCSYDISATANDYLRNYDYSLPSHSRDEAGNLYSNQNRSTIQDVSYKLNTGKAIPPQSFTNKDSDLWENQSRFDEMHDSYISSLNDSLAQIESNIYAINRMYN